MQRAGLLLHRVTLTFILELVGEVLLASLVLNNFLKPLFVSEVLGICGLVAWYRVQLTKSDHITEVD